MRGHLPFHLIAWTGAVVLLASSVPATAADSFCIPELTVARQPYTLSEVTAQVELQIRGTWTCGGGVPVLREFVREGSTTRVILAADAVSASPGPGVPFSLAATIGPLPPGENRIEIYLDDGTETRLLGFEAFDVRLSCLRDVSISAISYDEPGNPVLLLVEGYVCFGGFELDGVAVHDRTIRLRLRWTSMGYQEESKFSLGEVLGGLEGGRYTVEARFNFPWALPGYQRVASDSLYVDGFCEPRPGRASRKHGLGATLLVPYFEVDLKDADGPTTLISVGNASAEPVLTNVVLWTNWGIPSYAFPLYLAAHETRPIDLRSLFAGRVPESGPRDGTDGLPLGCEDPLVVPPPGLARLRAMHTGQPMPGGGDLCASEPSRSPNVALGYVTIDAVNYCLSEQTEEGRLASPTAEMPGDEGYFAAGGTGRASDRNVLWGDVLYVWPAQDSAQGIAAVALQAAPERFAGDGPHVTFYRGLVGGDGSDGRVPLGSSSRLRLINGGGLDMRTDLLVWTEGQGPGPPRLCGSPPPPGTEIDLDIEVQDPKGEMREGVGRYHHTLHSLRLHAKEQVMNASFGQLKVKASRGACPRCPSSSLTPEPLQTLVIPVLSADGRFSVAYNATPLDAACRR